MKETHKNRCRLLFNVHVMYEKSLCVRDLKKSEMIPPSLRFIGRERKKLACDNNQRKGEDFSL